MITEVFAIFTEQVFPAVIGWCESIFNAIGGALPYVIAFITIALATRFLIMPVISGRLFSGSDSARKRDKE